VSALNPYEAIGRFVRAYYFYNLTSMFGDVPQADALQGALNPNPAYTPQEQVFKYVLDQLDTANTDFGSLIAANDNSLNKSQDIYYAGNLVLWQKMVNTFKLRVLVALSSKSSDAILNVPAQFAAILGNSSKYPVFEAQADDFKFVYNPGGGNVYSTYPFNPSNFGSVAQRFNMAHTYMRVMDSLSDARVFMTTEPAWGIVPVAETNPCQFKYFKGASTGEPLATMYGNASAGLYSFINRSRYYSNFTGEMQKTGTNWVSQNPWHIMELTLQRPVLPLFFFLPDKIQLPRLRLTRFRLTLPRTMHNQRLNFLLPLTLHTSRSHCRSTLPISKTQDTNLIITGAEQAPRLLKAEAE
jgi:Starch-binding associating with outer membrane